MHCESFLRPFRIASDSCRGIRLAYRSGVTSGITAPQSTGFLAGLSAAFSTVSHHKLEDGALLQDVGALHVSISPVGVPSVSTQIAALRHILLGKTKGELGHALDGVKQVRRCVALDVG